MSSRRRRSIFDLIDEYFDEWEEWFERFRERLTERPSWNQKTCAVEPLRDIMVTPTEVIVTVDLPYTEESTAQVKALDEKTLEISARMKRKIRLEELGITHYKGEFQTFHCQTRIPVPVQMDKMAVRFKKGILEVRIPRKHEYTIPVE